MPERCSLGPQRWPSRCSRVFSTTPIRCSDEQEGDATYAAKIGADDRRLDLDRPARELVDNVRALSPHIGARAELHGRGVTIWRARVADDGSFEPVEVQPDGGRRMEYDAWLRGLRP